MKHLFILNPVAGGKKNRHSEIAAEIETLMAELGEPYEIYVTQGPMDAVEKVRSEAASGDPLRVYACGGDGTLSECVTGAAKAENAAVGVYPCGTGNDFVKIFGDDAARFQDMRELVCGETHPIDLIACNDRYSVNICSVGIDARIGTDVHKYSGLPLIGGATGYVTSLVVNVAKGVAEKFAVTSRRIRREGMFSLICVCNGQYYGGGFHPVPEARPDDGLLDILLVNKVSRLGLFRVIGKYAKGRYSELGDLVEHLRGTSLTVERETPFVINVDGEAMVSSRVEFALVPRGVRFICPVGTRLFEKSEKKTEEYISE